MYYFAFKTRLKISNQKLPNFAECIAGMGKFCGRVAAASCAKNYGDSKMSNLIVCISCGIDYTGLTGLVENISLTILNVMAFDLTSSILH